MNPHHLYPTESVVHWIILRLALRMPPVPWVSSRGSLEPTEVYQVLVMHFSRPQKKKWKKEKRKLFVKQGMRNIWSATDFNNSSPAFITSNAENMNAEPPPRNGPGGEIRGHSVMEMHANTWLTCWAWRNILKMCVLALKTGLKYLQMICFNDLLTVKWHTWIIPCCI